MKELELNKIHNCDCLEFMKTLPDKCIDLVLTDPPYGINADKGVGGFGTSKTDKHYKDDWDKKTPSQEYFTEMLRVGKKVVIFGGNFFTDKLPVNGHWIVWDKVGYFDFKNPFSDCELAWTNLPKVMVKKYQVIQQGFISEEKTRFHPTQKPEKIMAYIIRDYTEEGELVYDPFAGGGSTALAAQKLGRNYILNEISPEYCKIAEDRIKSISNTLF